MNKLNGEALGLPRNGGMIRKSDEQLMQEGLVVIKGLGITCPYCGGRGLSVIGVRKQGGQEVSIKREYLTGGRGIDDVIESGGGMHISVICDDVTCKFMGFVVDDKGRILSECRGI